MIEISSPLELLRVTKNTETPHPAHTVVGFHDVREVIDSCIDWKAGKLATACLKMGREECAHKDEAGGCRMSMYSPYDESHIEHVEFDCQGNGPECEAEVSKSAGRLLEGTRRTLMEVLEVSKIPEPSGD